MDTTLDDRLLALTEDDIKQEFRAYKLIKTDLLDDEHTVSISMGVDGIRHDGFEKQLDRHARNMISRLQANRYFFSPFREVVISKDYSLKRSTAIAKDKTRTLSIACVRDVLIQRLLYQIVGPYLEQLFGKTPGLDEVSFAYRPRKSAPAAARRTYKYIQQGYTYVLDADLRKFFDEIPHDALLDLVDETFGANVRVRTLIRRFVKADRVTADSYAGKAERFYRQKAQRTQRRVGIPQGGVLSGLIANLYLHPFDVWVVEVLSSQHDIKYVRYADDFVILARDPKTRDGIEELVRERLSELGLFLHTNREKTKLLDLNAKPDDPKAKPVSLDFVGFSLSPTGIRVKKTNMIKFKRRFVEKLWRPIRWRESPTPQGALSFIVERKMQFKLLGNWAEGLERCDKCGEVLALRSWVAFFATVTDVQQLQGLDKWIRRTLHSYMHQHFGVRFGAKELGAAGLARLAQVYYEVRYHLRDLQLCRCELWESNQARLKALSERNSPLWSLFDEIS